MLLKMVLILNHLQWNNLNTDNGADLFEYYQNLIELRKNSSAIIQLAIGNTIENILLKNPLFIGKQDDDEKYVIAANFDSQNQTFSIEFPNSGKWVDQISGEEINIESTWYGDYTLPTSEARIFKYIDAVYLPGEHNDWNLDTDNIMYQKENFWWRYKILRKNNSNNDKSKI